MYNTLLYLHHLTRWLVLISLLYAIYTAARGSLLQQAFTKAADVTRHITATIAHIQLLLGMVLYFKSPLVSYFWHNRQQAMGDMDISFFGLYHPVLMLVAIIIITIGSALAKRRDTNADKYKTMLLWYIVALLVIFIAIPWPFSPFANRPYFR